LRNTVFFVLLSAKISDIHAMQCVKKRASAVKIISRPAYAAGVYACFIGGKTSGMRRINAISTRHSTIGVPTKYKLSVTVSGTTCS
jgi:hypothetical protein